MTTSMAGGPARAVGSAGGSGPRLREGAPGRCRQAHPPPATLVSWVSCSPCGPRRPDPMTVDDSLLPSFAKPPVNEVVLSVAFDRPPGLSIAHLGDFWHQHLRSDFPQIEEQAPYHRPVEILGPPAPPAMNVQLMDRPPSPRLWAKSVDGTRLVQLQADWFAFNWRDAPDSELEYPRWPAIENGFLTQLRRLAEYLRRSGIPARS